MKEELEKLMNDDDLIEIARKAVEDNLVDFRESRISQLGRGNGLVICEVDGTPSDTIRFGMDTAMKIGLKAIIWHLKKTEANQ